MRARKDLLEMSKIAHHGDDVVLDVTQVQPDVLTRRDAVLLIATLGKSLDDIGFATKQTDERHDLFAAVANLLEDFTRLFGTSCEDVVLDRLGLLFDSANDRLEGIDNVIDQSVADPVGTKGYVISELRHTLPYIGRVRSRTESESDDALSKDNSVDVDRLHVVLRLLVHLIERTETDEIIMLEKLDFLTCFLRDDILPSEAVNVEGLANDFHLFFCRHEHIKPPDTSVRAELEQVLESFTRHQQVAKLWRVDGVLELRREEGPPVEVIAEQLATVVLVRPRASESPKFLLVTTELRIGCFRSAWIVVPRVCLRLNDTLDTAVEAHIMEDLVTLCMTRNALLVGEWMRNNCRFFAATSHEVVKVVEIDAEAISWLFLLGEADIVLYRTLV